MTEEEMNPQANAIMEAYGPAPGLDLSKIKNIEANNAKGNNLKTIQIKANKERKSKFCFTEEHEIELPTKGYLYQNCDDEDIKNGIVRMRPMSLADEDIIANQSYIKNGTVFVHLLNSCILNDFDARNFVSYDVFYLIYALRQITYGEDYEFTVNCPECEKKYDYNLQLSEVDFEQLEEPEDFEKTIKLPISKYSVSMRCSTLGDEEQVYKLSKLKEYEDYSDNVLGHVVRTIEILDTKGKEVPKSDYADFYQAIPGRDRAEITKAFKNIEGMLIPTVSCTCPKCGEVTRRTIPFNKEFFRY